MILPFDPLRGRRRRKAAERAEERRLDGEALMRREGYVPVTELSPSDVFVTGYPKSGNTWFQILTSVLVFGVDAELTPFTAIGELVPDLSARRFYRRHAKTMFYKTHALPNPQYERVVYLLRDGRDVMVSYKHYREVIDQTEYDFSTFVSAEMPLWPCHWSHHVEEWTRNPFGAQMLVIRYEDLVARPVEELARFCSFAGLDRSTETIQAAVSATSLVNLRTKESAEGNWDPNYKSSKPFFRRGQVGSHADELPPEALTRFLRHAGSTLQRVGYSVV